MKKLILSLSLILPTSLAFAAGETRLEKAENYLNKTQSYSANFEQFVPGEAISKGTFYLKKPGKFLWNYTTPREEKVVTSGSAIYYVEGEDGAVTQIPSNPSLTKLFTAQTVDFSNPDVSLLSIKEQNNSFTLTFELKDGDDVVGTAGLGFAKEPIQLKSLTTTDPTGQQVFVQFSDIQENVTISNSLFDVETPFEN